MIKLRLLAGAILLCSHDLLLVGYVGSVVRGVHRLQIGSIDLVALREEVVEAHNEVVMALEQCGHSLDYARGVDS